MNNAQWEFLREWCEPLRGPRRLVLRHEYHARVPTRTFQALLIRLPDKRDLMPLPWWHRLRDALVLLAMVARVDHAAWKHALVEFCGLKVENEDETLEGDDLQPRFVFGATEGLDEPSAVTSHVHALQTFVTEVNHLPSDEFLEAARRIIGFAPIGTELEIKIPITVELDALNFTAQGIDDPEAFAVRGMWESLKEIKDKYPRFRIPMNASALTVGATTCKCTFVLAPIDIECSTTTLTHSEVVLAEETAVVNGGLTIQSLNWVVDAAEVHDCWDIGTTGRMLEHFVCARASTTRASVRQIRVGYPQRAFDWGYEMGVEADLARLFSAIAEAGAIDSLVLFLELAEMAPEERTWVWKLLAYALFSEHSHSSISSVFLDHVAIGPADVDAVAAVITSDDPTHLVFGNQDTAESGSTTREMYSIKEGSVLTVRPTHPMENIIGPLEWTLGVDVAGVKVVADDHTSDAVTVLVPGYGLCSTRRDTLSPTAIGADSMVRSGVTSLRFVIRDEPGEWDGLPRLLELIGSSLTSLWIHISAEWDGIEEHLLRSCPNLETLMVDGLQLNAEAFVEAYRANNSRISELKCSFSETHILVRVLADPASLLSQNLRCLTCSDEVPDDNNQRQFADMLAANSKLEYLELEVPQDESWLALLKPFHNTPLAQEKSPLPLECRLAFISVLRFGNSSGQLRSPAVFGEDIPFGRGIPSGMHFDQLVLARIFAFAAISERRRVYLRWGTFD